jgi:hypothetical protein
VRELHKERAHHPSGTGGELCWPMHAAAPRLTDVQVSPNRSHPLQLGVTHGCWTHVA